MSWFTKTFSSTIGKKTVMALSGLFLVVFLIGHVSGNTLLFKDDGGEAFNRYAEFMTTNQLVQILRLLTAISIILHVVYSVVLTYNNKKARGIGYSVSNAKENSTWASRNMMLLGIVILAFLVLHLRSFLYEMKFGDVPLVSYEGTGDMKNLYSLVVTTFGDPLYTGWYVFAMLFLALHLFHGFQSTSQTLGFRHPKYNGLIKKAGYALGVVVCLLFAYMPVHIYLKTL